MVVIVLPTREELLAAELPVVRKYLNKEGKIVVYRYASEEAARDHMKAEAAAYAGVYK